MSGFSSSDVRQIPADWDPYRYVLYNESARQNDAFSEQDALHHYWSNGGPYTFESNSALRNKTHVVTLLGYDSVRSDHARHTNWYPWNRFCDVFKTLGYKCEWTNVKDFRRGHEGRIFIVWNEPSALELYEAGLVKRGDIVLQKLTSLGKGMEKVNWGNDAREWASQWNWPIYQTLEYLYDLGVDIYAFGCMTDVTVSPVKQRICERLSNRIFWIPWGGTPYTWKDILSAMPVTSGFEHDVVFVGSKWGKVGRGNIDAWERYLAPLEESENINFHKVGGIDLPMVSDDDMVERLRKGRVCPIIHAPSWQAEQGIQDRFFTVFLAGRFGVCDNIGAVRLFGDEVSEICTEDPESYRQKTLYFISNIEAQLSYIRHVQRLIKKQHNFYVSWQSILSSLPEMAARRDPAHPLILTTSAKQICLGERLASIAADGEVFLGKNAYDRLNRNLHLYASTFSKTVSILGNGPSLRGFPFENLRDKFTVSFNRAFLMYEDQNFFPCVYVCIDKAVLLNSLVPIEKLLDSPIQEFILLSCQETAHLAVHPKVTLVSKSRRNERYFGDVATFAIAYFAELNFKRFEVYGCDCSYIEDIETLGVDVVEYPDDPARRIVLKPRKGARDPNHFIDNYFGEGTEYSLPRESNHVRCWEAIRDLHVSENINVEFKTASKAEFLFTSRVKTSPAVIQIPFTGKPFVADSMAALRNASKVPLISIIVPVYNVDRYLNKCLATVCEQDDPMYEVIIIDDGSTDRSAEVISEFTARYTHVNAYRKDNGGLGSARNAGFELSRGEFVVFVDSDDFVDSNFVSELRRAQRRTNADVVSAQVAQVDESGAILTIIRDKAYPDVNPPLSEHEKVLGLISPSFAAARLFRREVLLGKENKFRDCIPHEDLFFTHKILRRVGCVTTVENVIYFWRQRQGSISKEVSIRHFQAIEELQQDTATFLDHIGASSREWELSARRSLVLTNWYRTKVGQQGDALTKDYYERVRTWAPWLHKALDIFKGSELFDSEISETASLILNTAKEIKIESPEGSASIAVDILFFPLRAYHLMECHRITRLLREAGRECWIVDTDDLRTGKYEVRKAALDNGIDTVSLATFVEKNAFFRVAVFFNDWDPAIRIVVEECQNAGTVTVGLVEGVQDYFDVDTGRQRDPYRRCEHVILPGKHDVKYFWGSEQSIHVGEIPRIKELWMHRYTSTAEKREQRCESKKVLINSNFSYGVLEKDRDKWVTEAVEATIASGMEPVLSRHPFDHGIMYKDYETSKTFYDALLMCDVSVQRFGSGILESLALGVPVIYFNPHGERVDKFVDSRDAYKVVYSRDDLESLLSREAFEWSENNAKEFLEYHAGLRDVEHTERSQIVQILLKVLSSSSPLGRPLGPLLKIRGLCTKDRKDIENDGRKVSARFVVPTDRKQVRKLKDANSLYGKGQYREALEVYEALMMSGGIYRNLHGNIAVCKRKIGDIG